MVFVESSLCMLNKGAKLKASLAIAIPARHIQGIPYTTGSAKSFVMPVS